MQFEQAFSQYIDGEGYDIYQDMLFQIIRAAFAAGWEASRREHEKVVSVDFEENNR